VSRTLNGVTEIYDRPGIVRNRLGSFDASVAVPWESYGNCVCTLGKTLYLGPPEKPFLLCIVDEDQRRPIREMVPAAYLKSSFVLFAYNHILRFRHPFFMWTPIFQTLILPTKP
jgi:hypothetical protein